MSLIIKPPNWGFCSTNIGPTQFFGTNFTCNANNADGTSVSALTAIVHDVEYLQVGIGAINGSGVNSSALIDILIDPAGGSSWDSDPLISDLLGGYSTSVGTTAACPLWYHFPIWVKAGASLGVRGRTAHTSNITGGRVALIASGGNCNPGSWWCGQKVTSIGINAASSQGTNHTAGVSGAFSSWTNFGSTLPSPCGAMQFAVQSTNADVTQNTGQYAFEFGVGSQRIGSPIYRTTLTTEIGWSSPAGLVFVELPSGAQLQVRASNFTTPAEDIDVAAYAVH